MIDFNSIFLIYRIHPYVTLDYNLFNFHDTKQGFIDTVADQLTELNVSNLSLAMWQTIIPTSQITKQLNINLFL